MSIYELVTETTQQELLVTGRNKESGSEPAIVVLQIKYVTD